MPVDRFRGEVLTNSTSSYDQEGEATKVKRTKPKVNHEWILLRKLTDEEQFPYVVWYGQWQCTKCGSIDLDPGPTGPNPCGEKIYYGITPQMYKETYGRDKPE